MAAEGSSNVFPCFAYQDATNSVIRKFEMTCDLTTVELAGSGNSADLSNQFIIQDGETIPFPSGVSSFGDSIFSIISFGAEKQVRWINTSSIITFVEDAKSYWDRSIVKFPADSVSRIEFSTLTHHDSVISVGAAVLMSRYPTTFKFRNVRGYRAIFANLRPESFFEWNDQSFSIAFARAKFPHSFLDVAERGMKGFVASLAFSRIVHIGNYNRLSIRGQVA